MKKWKNFQIVPISTLVTSSYFLCFFGVFEYSNFKSHVLGGSSFSNFWQLLIFKLPRNFVWYFCFSTWHFVEEIFRGFVLNTLRYHRTTTILRIYLLVQCTRLIVFFRQNLLSFASGLPYRWPTVIGRGAIMMVMDPATPSIRNLMRMSRETLSDNRLLIEILRRNVEQRQIRCSTVRWILQVTTMNT